MQRKLFSLEEAARRLGIAPTDVRSLIKRNILPAYSTPMGLMVHEADLEVLLEEGFGLTSEDRDRDAEQ